MLHPRRVYVPRAQQILEHPIYFLSVSKDHRVIFSGIDSKSVIKIKHSRASIIALKLSTTSSFFTVLVELISLSTYLKVAYVTQNLPWLPSPCTHHLLVISNWVSCLSNDHALKNVAEFFTWRRVVLLCHLLRTQISTKSESLTRANV